MTLTAHSLIAAAIVTKISNPIIGLPIVFASHFVMDKVPHWDVMTNKDKTIFQIGRDTLLDILFGFISAGLFFLFMPGLDPVYFLTAIVLSQSPDLLEAPYVFPQINNPLSKIVYKFQHYIHDLWFDSRMEAPWGIVTQVVITSLFLLWAIV
jgi:hypothetical protein